MKKDAWMNRAKKLAGKCSEKHKAKQGSEKCTTAEASEATALNHAIGSHHGIHETAYSALGTSLQQMINWVKEGKKDEFFEK